MIQPYQINSVSKNNFLSLMSSYEQNFKDLSKLICLDIITQNNELKKFVSFPNATDKKLSLLIKSVTNHTAIIKFSYDFFSDDICINYVELKIYFDSRQVEIMSTNDNRSSKILSNIRFFITSKVFNKLKQYFQFPSITHAIFIHQCQFSTVYCTIIFKHGI